MTFEDTIAHQHWIGLAASITEIVARFADWQDILHPSEIDVFANIHSKTYQESWFAGRVLAKNLYINHSAAAHSIHWKEIQVLSRNSSGQSIAPRLLVGGRDTSFVFSLSHVADKAIAVAPTDFIDRIGCDLVFRDTVTPGIVKAFFHDEEATDHQGYEAIWAVKEASFKACNSNGSFQPRQWLTQRVGENLYLCHHLDGDWQLSAEAETVILDDYTLAVARKFS
jgi:phosphopantetheinyl transferase (holo-ACP synthase)